jgi:plasmid stabilization system protein ParE
VPYNYILHEHAQEDYETSLKWYAERSEQAAENFITAVEDALKLICANPTRWRNTQKKTIMSWD